MRIGTAWLLLPLAACAVPPADQPSFIGLGAGYAQADDPRPRPALASLELRRPPMEAWGLVPTLGAWFADDDSTYVYIAVRRDFWLSERWVVTPSFGPGAFDEGDHIPLASRIEFRSGVELAYRLPDETRLGLSFSHVSNAGFGEPNPGTEVLLLKLALPID